MNKRTGIIIGLIVIVLVSLIVPPYLLRAGRGERIALITLSGTIAGTEQAGFLTTSPGITPRLVRGYLSMAAQDSAVKAVVLRIDSPGGSAAASQEIAEMIKQFEKPIVVSMGDVAASGGYYISVYADKIIAEPSTMTGSIGVIMQIFDISRLLEERLLIDVRTITSPKDGYKDISNLPDEELQKMCDDVYNEFIEAIAEGRDLSIKEVRQLATGQPYTGKQALELGLVDGLGGLDDAIALAADLAGVEKPVVEEYRPLSLWERLLRLLTKIEQFFSPKLSDEQILFLRTLEGWQAVPRY